MKIVYPKSEQLRGTVYIDGVTAGSTTYSFEDGTTQGWTFWPSDGMVTNLTNSTDYAYDGTHSLAVQLNATNTETSIFVTPPGSVNPGDTVTLHVFIPSDAPISATNSIASDMQVAKNLNKPFLLGESGIKSNTFCSDSDCYPLATRAGYFSDKISAFFNNGGAGYLIWGYPVYVPESDVFGFNTSDPLYTVVQTDAAILNSGGDLEVSERLFFLLPLLLILPFVLYILTNRQRRKRALFLLLYGNVRQLHQTFSAPFARLLHSFHRRMRKIVAIIE